MEPTEQPIRFCTTADGVRIAYTVMGAGPPVLRVLGWFTHLEYESQRPGWRPFIDGLADRYLVVRFDGRGMGLSDRDAADFSLDAKLRDLEAVVGALRLRRFALLGTSEGGMTALAYAVRHPQRVSHLVLYGSPTHFDRSREALARRDAIITLIRQD